VLVLLLLGGAGALALVAVGGWWIARRALRPVDRMTTRAEAIGIDDLAQRIAVPRVTTSSRASARTVENLLTLARVDEGRRRIWIDDRPRPRTTIHIALPTTLPAPPRAPASASRASR
jgi:hypothetical protein